MKRFLSILLTLTMIIGLAASALAAAPYTLTYDANGGNTVAAGTTDGDGKIALGTATHEADADGNAIALIGWTETKDETIYAADATIEATYYWPAGKEITLTENKTLYALWGLDTNGNGTADAVEDGTAYTLTYDANNGTGAPEAQKGKGTVKLSTTEPTREGYKFLGWVAGAAPTDIAKDATNPDLSAVKHGGESVDLTADTTYFAQWAVDENKNGTADYEEDRYTVKYDIGNEITKDGVVRTLGTAMTSPAEEPELVSGTTHTLATPSVTTNTAKYDVEEETANVAFLGWTTDPAVAFELYDVGDTVTVVKEIVVGDTTANKADTLPENEIVYYAVWGYDNNNNGKADIDDAADAADAAEEAAKTDTIKITQKDPTPGTFGEEQYKAWKIFDVTKTSEVVENVTTDETVGQTVTEEMTGFSYTIPKTDTVWLPAIGTVTNGVFAPTTGQDWLVLVETSNPDVYTVIWNEDQTANEENAKALAAYLYKYAKDHDIAPSGDFKFGETWYTNPGYYLVDSTLGTNLILATTNIEIQTKNDYSTTEKTVAKTNYSVGDLVEYTIKVELPASVDYTQPIIIHDTMDDVLALKNDSFVVAPSTVTGTLDANPADGHTFDYTLNISALAPAEGETPAAKTVTVTYKAELLSSAASDQGYVNKEFVQQSEYKTPETPPAEIKTYDFDLEKKFTGNTSTETLKATFKLYPAVESAPTEGTEGEATTEKAEAAIRFIDGGTVDGKDKTYVKVDSDDGEGDEIIEVTVVNKQAKITNVRGLSAGKYYLTEISTAEGYNVLTEDVVIIIDENGNVTIDGTGDLFAVEGQTVTVTNNSGTVLPSTGGIGTTIFYIVGGLLAVGAGVVLVTKKRMGKEEN